MSGTIILVGGNSGIGKAIYDALSAKGESIVAFSKSNSEYPVDIQDENPNFPTIEAPIKALIYTPGTINLKPFRSLKLDQYKEDFEVNVLGLIKTLKFYEKELTKSPGASVVAFSTVAVQTGMPFHASVSVAKAGIEGLVRTLAAEWAPKVRVNAIAPSLTNTPLAENLLNNEKKEEAAKSRHPLKKYAEPSHIAMAVEMLIENPFITGQVIQVDGGMSSVRL